MVDDLTEHNHHCFTLKIRIDSSPGDEEKEMSDVATDDLTACDRNRRYRLENGLFATMETGCMISVQSIVMCW